MDNSIEVIRRIINLKLPRKYKISFSKSLEDIVNAIATDIGFIAKIVDGKREREEKFRELLRSELNKVREEEDLTLSINCEQ